MYDDIRYSDTDLRTYPQLGEIALEYAVDYAGEWDFMVAARSLAQQTGTLTTATARAVLNAMRADPKVVMSLPRKEELEPAPKHLRVNKVERDLSTVVIEEYLYPFNVEIKWNMDWLLATSRQATAAHLLSHERSHLVYYPMYGKRNYKFIKHQYEIKLKSECGATFATGHLFNGPMDRHTCNQCKSQRLERNSTNDY